MCMFMGIGKMLSNLTKIARRDGWEGVQVPITPIGHQFTIPSWGVEATGNNTSAPIADSSPVVFHGLIDS